MFVMYCSCVVWLVFNLFGEVNITRRTQLMIGREGRGSLVMLYDWRGGATIFFLKFHVIGYKFIRKVIILTEQVGELIGKCPVANPC